MARQWQVARVNMKAVKNFEEGKETTEVNPTEEQGDKAQKIKVNSSKTTISSKKYFLLLYLYIPFNINLWYLVIIIDRKFYIWRM